MKDSEHVRAYRAVGALTPKHDGLRVLSGGRRRTLWQRLRRKLLTGRTFGP